MMPKALLLLFLVTFQAYNLYSQSDTTAFMEIEKVISNEIDIRGFIKNNFSETYVSLADQLAQNHSLYGYKFNRVLNSLRVPYSIFGLPIDRVYAYVDGQNVSSLYLVLNTGSSGLDSLAKGLGMPRNVNQESLDSGDFDLLYWKTNGFNIFLGDDFYPGASFKQRGILIISNTDIRNLHSKERLR